MFRDNETAYRTYCTGKVSHLQSLTLLSHSFTNAEPHDFPYWGTRSEDPILILIYYLQVVSCWANHFTSLLPVSFYVKLMASVR